MIYPDNAYNLFRKCNFINYKKHSATILASFLLPLTSEYIIARVDQYSFVFQIELSKFVAVNFATAHAHYEGEATYNIGSSFKGRPHINIIKIHSPIGDGGESIVWCKRESEWELCECNYVYIGGEKKLRKFVSVGMCIHVFTEVTSILYNGCRSA